MPLPVVFQKLAKMGRDNDERKEAEREVKLRGKRRDRPTRRALGASAVRGKGRGHEEEGLEDGPPQRHHVDKKG